MTNRYLIPFAIILMLLLAACSSGQTAEVSQAEVASMPEMADEGEEAMEEMSEEAHDDGDDMARDDGDQNGEMEESGQQVGGQQVGMDDDMDAMDDDMDAMDDDMDDMDDDDMEAMEEKEESSEMMAANLPAWQTIALTNAATGETFTLGDFQGKAVFVEPMATWCSNCRQQQGHVREAKAQLGDDVVFIGLSLETNLPPGDLASYAQGNGFDWTYAVMPVELLAQLTDEFGRSITSAPSTPHFIIRPDGSFTDLVTGIHPASALIAEIQAEQG